mgnify:CR=1 FL=1
MCYIEREYDRYLESLEDKYECLECGTEILREGFCSRDCSDASWL